jgi:small GTP-binding protein
MLVKKVLLTGSFGVGKTSLFERFINSHFSDKYLSTIGLKVSKKVIDINGNELSLMLWDIAGEVTQDKVPVSYFLGASGIIYVFDLTRPSTHKNIQQDLEYLRKIVPEASISIVGNKKDLLSSDELNQVLAALDITPNIVTSAKTGENVNQLFLQVGKELLG